MRKTLLPLPPLSFDILCKVQHFEEYAEVALDASCDPESMSFGEKLEQHLNTCQPCQECLASLQATVEQCRRSGPERLDRKKAARLRLKVLADYEYMVAKKVRR